MDEEDIASRLSELTTFEAQDDQTSNKVVKHPELLFCINNVLEFMEYHPKTWPRTADDFLDYLGNFSTTTFLLDPMKIVTYLHFAQLWKPTKDGNSHLVFFFKLYSIVVF
jgi:hypothetical protein